METARGQQWTYDVFLQQAVGAEVQRRAQRAYERRVRSAHLPGTALSTSLESFDFGFQPTLSEPLIRELATLGFVQTATNIVLLGPPGVGKTHLALALLARALEAGYSARFTTLRQLADELETTSWRQQRRRYLSPKLLVIDEVGYLRLSTSQAHQLFDLVTARYEQAPTILTSNRSFTDWGMLVGDEVLATALLDRLLHHAEVIAIAGRSYRMKDRAVPELPVTGAESRQSLARKERVGQFFGSGPHWVESERGWEVIEPGLPAPDDHQLACRLEVRCEHRSVPVCAAAPSQRPAD